MAAGSPMRSSCLWSKASAGLVGKLNKLVCMAVSLKWSSPPQCAIFDCAKHSSKVTVWLPGCSWHLCPPQSTCAWLCPYLCWQHPRAAMKSQMCIYFFLAKQVSSKKFWCFFFIPNQQGPDSCVQFKFTQNASQKTLWCVFFCCCCCSVFFSLFSRCLQVVCDNAEIWLLLDVWQNMMYRLSFLFVFLIKCLLWWCSSKTCL